MKNYLIGYVYSSYLPSVTKEDAKKWTHMNIAFGLIRDGLLSLHNIFNLDTLPRIKEWNPDLKIVLSVGGWGAGGFSTMAKTKEGRVAFAKSCLEAVEKYNLDGIDIDWEYPCDGSADIDYSPEDKENYTYLFEDLREVLGKERILSNAVGAGRYFIEGSQMDKVAEILDYVQLMTYDMRSGFSNEAGHHASLGLSKGDTSEKCTVSVVEMFHEAGVPYEKLIVGAAFYCRTFDGVANINNGLLQKSESIGQYGPEYKDLKEFIKDKNFREYWDENAEAAYLFNGSTFISYESKEAIRRKARFVKEKGLLGIMYWEHSCDESGELLSAMYDELRKL